MDFLTVALLIGVTWLLFNAALLVVIWRRGRDDREINRRAH